MRHVFRAAIALAGLAAASTASAAINNGGFENPDIYNTGWQSYLSNGGGDMTSHGSVGTPFSSSVDAPAGTGNYVAVMHVGAVGDYQRLWQDFTVVGTGATVSALINFYGMYGGDEYIDDAYFQVGTLDSSGNVTNWTKNFTWNVQANNVSDDWSTYTYTLGAPGTYRVEFGVRNVGDDFDDMGSASELRIDNVMLADVAPVPEPAEWAMMVAGLGLVGAVARRRKSA